MFNERYNVSPENIPSASRITQVAAEFAEMDGRLEELSKTIETLVNRLQPVLREVEPARNSEKAVMPPAVPLAEHLRQRRYTISIYVGRLSDLLERLEL